MDNKIVIDIEEAKKIINEKEDLKKYFDDCFSYIRYDITNIDNESLIGLIYSYHFKRYTKDNGEWTIFDEPLIFILGKMYKVNIDNLCNPEKDSIGFFYDKNTLPNEKILELCPELTRLNDVSLAARKMFILMIKRANKESSLINVKESKRISNLHHLKIYEEAIQELLSNNLINRTIKTKNLLSEISKEKLQKYVIRMHLRLERTKYETISMIINHVPHNDVEKFFREEKGLLDNYYQVEVSAIRELKDFVWNEERRIESYLNIYESYFSRKELLTLYDSHFNDPNRLEKETVWIKERQEIYKQDIHINLDDYKPQTETQINIVSNMNEDKNMKPWANWGWGKKGTNLFKQEVNIMRKYWTKEMDEKIIQLYKQYAWESPWFFREIFINEISAETLAQYIEEWEEKGTHGWGNVPMYFGELRIKEMKIPLRKPKVKICKNCKKKFLESSVRFISYKDVISTIDDINYCDECYSMIYYQDKKSVISHTREELIFKLKELINKTGIIPTKEMFENPKLIYRYNKTDDVLIMLINIPPIAQYINEFGSWFKALIAAGTIENERIKNARGYLCIARDGHECYSLSEKLIDDWLTKNKIEHEKETKYPFDNELNPYGMRTDWLIDKTYVEFAGLLGDPYYDERIEKKKTLAEKYKFELIIIDMKDLGRLEEKLGKFI